MDVYGQTRSRLARDHALITPDTHVDSPLVGWSNSTSIIHISPEIGARFLQYTAKMGSGGKSGLPGNGVERFIYVDSGSVGVDVGSQSKALGLGGFAFLPANVEHQIEANSNSTLIVFEKLYVPFDGKKVPAPVLGEADNVKGEAFMGDPDAVLQTLLPISPEYDMAINIFTYQPGATLPQVEIHVMEHGMQMIAGQGLYRLSESYYPVGKGDVIWMASYCPQWFVAMGKQPAAYIYYKDIHRDSLTDRQELIQ